MDEKQFWEEVEKREKVYSKIKDKKNPTDFERIYRHDAANIISGIKDLSDMGLNVQEIIKTGGLNYLKNLRTLEKILDLKNFTKEEMISESPYSVKVILENSLRNYERYEPNFRLNLKASGIKANSGLVMALFNTHIGDAVKWSPEQEPIEINTREEGKNIYTKIKNTYGKTPEHPEIGEGKGVGTEYTKQFLNAWGGKISINESKGKFTKEIVLPKY